MTAIRAVTPVSAKPADVKARAKRLDTAIERYSESKNGFILALVECINAKQWEGEALSKTAWVAQISGKLNQGASTTWLHLSIADFVRGLPEKDWREVPDENLATLAKLGPKGTTQKWLAKGKATPVAELKIAVRKELGQEERRGVNVPQSQQQAFKEAIAHLMELLGMTHAQVFDALIADWTTTVESELRERYKVAE